VGAFQRRRRVFVRDVVGRRLCDGVLCAASGEGCLKGGDFFNRVGESV
jgi:hypothetical protein